MLETMRSFAKGRIAQVLLGVLSLSFVGWGVRDFSGSFVDWAMSISGWGPKDLVHVGSNVIRADEYTKAKLPAKTSLLRRDRILPWMTSGAWASTSRFLTA